MKNAFTLLAAATMITACVACAKDQDIQKEPEKPKEPEKIVFAEGADISWVTQMEKDGMKFHNASRKETECTALMKEIGFDAIRLRVWVDPEDGWCGKDDVLEKARRAQDLGMRLMIDFHYSDFWADPGKQNPPEAWKGYDIAQMADAVSGHTHNILKSLKDNGIDVEWVQLGNEVNNGMLWPLGKVQGSTAGNFIRLINLGYDIVKDMYPEAEVILHVSNGHDAGLFNWFFNLMHSGKARYDMIGMSLYPSWRENGGLTPWKPVVDKCMANIKSMITKFNKPVMLCEVGMPVSEPQTAKEALQYILDQTKAIEGCHGVFYWEPQTDGVWKPSSYEGLGWGAYDMGAFRNGKPTMALDPFGNQTSSGI